MPANETKTQQTLGFVLNLYQRQEIGKNITKHKCCSPMIRIGSDLKIVYFRSFLDSHLLLFKLWEVMKSVQSSAVCKHA